MSLFNQQEPFCVIIPDRGDRKKFTAFCKKQIQNQTLSPQKIYHINFEPASGMADLMVRLWNGIQMAKKDHIDCCYVIENDDYYPYSYFNDMRLKEYDIVGIPKTIYYHIFGKQYKIMKHPIRSSLFCTGFRISAIKDFEWPSSVETFIDIKLWEYAISKGLKVLFNEPANMPIGIKHGVGKCGGAGHYLNKLKYDYDDPDLNWLRANVNRHAFDFYSKL